MEPLILEPEFTLDFDGGIHVGPVLIADGVIKSIGHDQPLKRISLKNQVLMPGFVNAHSHAFQRALRGLTEKKASSLENFFSWRQFMYGIAEHISPDDMHMLACLVYLEMLKAGFTDVGEFHYLHHDVSGKPYRDPLTMSTALTKAALQTGINLCLLLTAYHRANFSQSIGPEQRRFYFPTVLDYLSLLEQAKTLVKPSITLGAAIHSVRAVPDTWFTPIHDYVQTHNLPLHIHVSEQADDLASCLTHTGLSPLGLLHHHHLVSKRTTLVHAIHLIEDDFALLKKTTPTICLCSSTEKNLGDGIIKLKEVYENNPYLCLGTDQHVRMDPFDEARSLDELERLRLEKRRALGNEGSYLYQTLLPCLTKNGLRSLYLNDDPKLINAPANLIAVELPPEYLWHGPDSALDAMMISHTPNHITHVITNGKVVVAEKQPLYADYEYLIKNIKKLFEKIKLK